MIVNFKNGTIIFMMCEMSLTQSIKYERISLHFMLLNRTGFLSNSPKNLFLVSHHVVL